MEFCSDWTSSLLLYSKNETIGLWKLKYVMNTLDSNLFNTLTATRISEEISVRPRALLRSALVLCYSNAKRTSKIDTRQGQMLIDIHSTCIAPSLFCFSYRLARQIRFGGNRRAAEVTLRQDNILILIQSSASIKSIKIF